jgi:hypothetical protein
MRMSTPKGLALVVAITLVGCGFSPEKKGNPGTGTGTGGTPDISGLGGAAGTIFGQGGAGNESLDAGNFCGVNNRPLVALPPDVLIVLDRSGSMDNDIDDRGCTDGGMGTGQCGTNSKWGIMTPAIKQVVSATEGMVNWGLKFFADTNSTTCNVNNNANVPVAMMNATAVNNAITGQTNAQGGISNGSRTPTRAGVTGAVTYLNSIPDQNPKFILLATDGLPNCPASGGNSAADDSMAAVAAVQTAFNGGIPTFVIGIATSGMGAADTTLNMMATAGGYPQMGTPAYYSVASQQALTDALTAIVGKVGGECRFGLGALPSGNDGRTSYDKINVFADGAKQDRDTTHQGGWDYADQSHMSIVLAGQLCQDVMDGKVQVVSVAFTCIEP